MTNSMQSFVYNPHFIVISKETFLWDNIEWYMFKFWTTHYCVTRRESLRICFWRCTHAHLIVVCVCVFHNYIIPFVCVCVCVCLHIWKTQCVLTFWIRKQFLKIFWSECFKITRKYWGNISSLLIVECRSPTNDCTNYIMEKHRL